MHKNSGQNVFGQNCDVNSVDLAALTGGVCRELTLETSSAFLGKTRRVIPR